MSLCTYQQTRNVALVSADRQTDRQTDRQADSSIPPLHYVAGGINIWKTDFKCMEVGVQQGPDQQRFWREN